MKRLALVALVSLLSFSRSYAGGLDLGIAGNNALNQGSFDQAIDLFTRALRYKNLSPDDRENVYVNRGLAYLKKGNSRLAIQDFTAALRLKSSDEDARTYLAAAQRSAVAENAVSPANVRVASLLRNQAAWGAMARLPGHTWLEIDDKPMMYFQYQWEEPWKVLTFTGMDKNGNAFAGQYQLDETTSQISGMAVYKGQAGQSLVQTTADSWTDEAQSGKSQTRQTFQAAGPAAFQLSQTWLKNGKWYQGKPMQYVQASPTVIASLGWTTAPPQPSFWSGMLSSMKAGALAGLQDGIHDGVHDRTQCGIAGKKTQAPGCTTGP